MSLSISIQSERKRHLSRALSQPETAAPDGKRLQPPGDAETQRAPNS